MDFRWSVNLKAPLPSYTNDKTSTNETSSNVTPVKVLREVKNPENKNKDPFAYRLDLNNFSKYKMKKKLMTFFFRLFFERDRILANVQEMMRSFDNDVCLLYYLKIIKTLRAKETDLRCITFYEELMLMKEFERTETDLENKVTDAQKRYDTEQAKVSFSLKSTFIYCLFFCRSMNFNLKLKLKRKILML